MNKSKSIFAGLVMLAVADCRSTAIGTAVPAIGTAAAGCGKVPTSTTATSGRPTAAASPMTVPAGGVA
jgi:hypothetical protein